MEGAASTGRSTPVVVHCQMISPKSICTSNIVWIQQVVVKTIYVYSDTYTYKIAFNEKRGYEFKENWVGYMGGFGQRKQKEEIL